MRRLTLTTEHHRKTASGEYETYLTREPVTCLDDMWRSDAYERYISDKLGNDLFINDHDRASRIYDAAEDGADGSTHGEHIDDQREFLSLLSVWNPETDADENPDDYDITQEVHDRISSELDEVEKWHAEHGTLGQQIM